MRNPKCYGTTHDERYHVTSIRTSQNKCCALIIDKRQLQRSLIAAHSGVLAMPDILETTDLEAQIEALISMASNCLRRQLEDIFSKAESAQDQSQDAVPST